MSRVSEDNKMAALKRTIKGLLKKHHEEIRAIHVTVYGGYPHHVTYAARDKDSKHFIRHKAGLRQTEGREGRIELLEVVNA
jgi:hypothetical protein